MAVELQTGEILVEISVDDLRLRIWDIIRPWNWGVIELFQNFKCLASLDFKTF